MRAAAAMILLTAAIAATASDPAEGRWQVTDGGPLVDIRPSAVTPGDLDVVWVDGPDMSVLPGTVIATMVPAASVGVYDCTAPADPRGRRGRRDGIARFIVRLDKSRPGRMTFEPYERKIVFNLRVLLPWWWRRAVSVVDTRPSGIDGAVRTDAAPSPVEL